MARIVDVNKHGIRREIDHQWRKKKNGSKKNKKNFNSEVLEPKEKKLTRAQQEVIKKALQPQLMI